MAELDQETTILIGREVEHISLRVGGRKYPNSADEYDQDQVICWLEVRHGSFSAALSPEITLGDLLSFRSGLEKMSRDLSGNAQLSTLEPSISLNLNMAPNGHIHGDAEFREGQSYENSLKIELHDLDQTDLPAIIAAITAVEHKLVEVV